MEEKKNKQLARTGSFILVLYSKNLFSPKSFIFIPLILVLFSFVNKPAARYNLDFFTAHNQFYLSDSGYLSNTGDDEFWSPQAYAARLAVADDVLGISIASYGHVKAQLNVLDAPDKEKDFSRYDHVVEAGVKISSGLLLVYNYPDSKVALKAIVTPGTYRVRVYSYGLTNVNPDEDEGVDHYKINLWKDNNTQRKVLKQFEKEE